MAKKIELIEEKIRLRLKNAAKEHMTPQPISQAELKALLLIIDQLRTKIRKIEENETNQS